MPGTNNQVALAWNYNPSNSAITITETVNTLPSSAAESLEMEELAKTWAREATVVLASAVETAVSNVDSFWENYLYIARFGEEYLEALKAERLRKGNGSLRSRVEETLRDTAGLLIEDCLAKGTEKGVKAGAGALKKSKFLQKGFVYTANANPAITGDLVDKFSGIGVVSRVLYGEYVNALNRYAEQTGPLFFDTYDRFFDADSTSQSPISMCHIPGDSPEVNFWRPVTGQVIAGYTSFRFNPFPGTSTPYPMIMGQPLFRATPDRRGSFFLMLKESDPFVYPPINAQYSQGYIVQMNAQGQILSKQALPGTSAGSRELVGQLNLASGGMFAVSRQIYIPQWKTVSELYACFIDPYGNINNVRSLVASEHSYSLADSGDSFLHQGEISSHLSGDVVGTHAGGYTACYYTDRFLEPTNSRGTRTYYAQYLSRSLGKMGEPVVFPSAEALPCSRGVTWSTPPAITLTDGTVVTAHLVDYGASTVHRDLEIKTPFFKTLPPVPITLPTTSGQMSTSNQAKQVIYLDPSQPVTLDITPEPNSIALLYGLSPNAKINLSQFPTVNANNFIPKIAEVRTREYLPGDFLSGRATAASLSNSAKRREINRLRREGAENTTVTATSNLPSATPTPSPTSAAANGTVVNLIDFSESDLHYTVLTLPNNQLVVMPNLSLQNITANISNYVVFTPETFSETPTSAPSSVAPSTQEPSDALLTRFTDDFFNEPTPTPSLDFSSQLSRLASAPSPITPPSLSGLVPAPTASSNASNALSPVESSSNTAATAILAGSLLGAALLAVMLIAGAVFLYRFLKHRYNARRDLPNERNEGLDEGVVSRDGLFKNPLAVSRTASLMTIVNTDDAEASHNHNDALSAVNSLT